ncbi:MAG: HEAT repeat domain-containing protein [Muribaculaceae bacterium]|jgi:hypothetical protein|nr:HEAT repeat domain-containing protein [Muribaculaceae bacterium]
MDNTLEYGIGYLSYYYLYLYDIFIGFSLIIRICVLVILASTAMGLYLLFQTIYLYLRKHKDLKIYNKFKADYRDTINRLGNLSSIYTPEEIAEMMNYDRRKPFSDRERRLFIQLLVEMKVEIGEGLNRTNFHNIIVAFDLPHFFERELQYAKVKYRVRLLTWLRFLEESVPGAVIIPLLYHKNGMLRKAAQAAFMWNSKSDPFRFFDNEDFDKRYRPWDKIDIHSIFDNRQCLGLNIPDLAHWLKSPQNNTVKPMFASEIRYLGKNDECQYMVEPFRTTENQELKSEIAHTFGSLRYRESEKLMIDSYRTQPESVKKSIIESVAEMNTGKSLQFLYDSYNEASDFDVRFAAAKGMYNYGQNGRQMFEQLERLASPADSRIFQHIKDPIINHKYNEVI